MRVARMIAGLAAVITAVPRLSPETAGSAAAEESGTRRARGKSRARKAGAAVAAVASVAGMVFAAAPATAAEYPTSSFSISDGEGSYYYGTATWYNRSVGLTGTFKAVQCRRIYGRAFTGSTSLDFKSSSTWCNRTGQAPMGLDANVVGGADNIWVYMTDPYGNYIDGDTCYRNYSVCVDGLH